MNKSEDDFDPRAFMARMEVEMQKAALKEALKEWLDAQWAAFGKWTARGLAVAAFGVLAYLWLTQHGWRMGG